MKQGPAVIVNDRIRGSKHYQPVTVRKRLLKPLQSLQRQRAIVQRAKMIRGQLENLPEIGCRDSMIASRAFHGALVEMRFGVTRTQLWRTAHATCQHGQAVRSPPQADAWRQNVLAKA